MILQHYSDVTYCVNFGSHLVNIGEEVSAYHLLGHGEESLQVGSGEVQVGLLRVQLAVPCVHLHSYTTRGDSNLIQIEYFLYEVHNDSFSTKIPYYSDICFIWQYNVHYLLTCIAQHIIIQPTGLMCHM